MLVNVSSFFLALCFRAYFFSFIASKRLLFGFGFFPRTFLSLRHEPYNSENIHTVSWIKIIARQEKKKSLINLSIFYLLDMEVLWVHLQKSCSGPLNSHWLSQSFSSEKQPKMKSNAYINVRRKMNQIVVDNARPKTNTNPYKFMHSTAIYYWTQLTFFPSSVRYLVLFLAIWPA